MKLLCTFSFIFSLSAFAGLPERPSIPSHPGSASYSNTIFQESFSAAGRKMEFFAPKEAMGKKNLALIVFGHGQAINSSGYKESIEHLVKKGVAVAFPEYDSGFFDQDWRRMAGDFSNLAHETLQRYSDSIDPRKVVFAGHSKGAYIALMAAGIPGRRLNPGAVVLFAPAGYDAEYLRAMDPATPVTIIWGDSDTIIKESAIQEIYNGSPSRRKQYIRAKSYPELSADHYIPLSKSFFFGGRNGISAFHYFGVWKWLLGAAWDLDSGGRLENPYLYGNEAASTGVDSLRHTITRSWQ